MHRKLSILAFLFTVSTLCSGSCDSVCGSFEETKLPELKQPVDKPYGSILQQQERLVQPGSLPTGAVIPSTTVYGVHTPGGVLPNINVPEGGAPGTIIPGTTQPDVTMPQNTFPQSLPPGVRVKGPFDRPLPN